jgi:hypothetical protein
VRITSKATRAPADNRLPETYVISLPAARLACCSKVSGRGVQQRAGTRRWRHRVGPCGRSGRPSPAVRRWSCRRCQSASLLLEKRRGHLGHCVVVIASHREVSLPQVHCGRCGPMPVGPTVPPSPGIAQELPLRKGLAAVGLAGAAGQLQVGFLFFLGQLGCRRVRDVEPPPLAGATSRQTRRVAVPLVGLPRCGPASMRHRPPALRPCLAGPVTAETGPVEAQVLSGQSRPAPVPRWDGSARRRPRSPLQRVVSPRWPDLSGPG